MSSYSLQLPNDLMEVVQRLAVEKQLSLQEWLLATIEEKVDNEQSLKMLQSYAARVDEAAFDAVMAKVPDVPPMPGDELLA
jgi:hypothetical protein